MIQEIRLRKQNQYGAFKELESISYTIDGVYCYSHMYNGERFERPIMKAYKISLRESYRQNGQVEKKQYCIGTISYYDLVKYSLYDCCGHSIEALSLKLDIDEDDIYSCIDEKLEPIQTKIIKEFEQTEEFKVNKKNEDIIRKHKEAEEAFKTKYNSDDYNYCYNIYGELMNKEYLQKIKDNYKTYSYYSNNFNNYYTNNNSSSSSYRKVSSSDYTADEKAMLKKFYKSLAIKYHPDADGDVDTTREMMLLNKLKVEWKL